MQTSWQPMYSFQMNIKGKEKQQSNDADAEAKIKLKIKWVYQKICGGATTPNLQ